MLIRDPEQYDPPTQMTRGWGWECGSRVCGVEWPTYGKLGLINGVCVCLSMCMYVCLLIKI